MSLINLSTMQHIFNQKTVKKIAADVTFLHILKSYSTVDERMTYICHIVEAGSVEPTIQQIINSGWILFKNDPKQENISSSDGIDVYIYCDDGGAPGIKGIVSTWSGIKNIQNISQDIIQYKTDKGDHYFYSRFHTLEDSAVINFVLSTGPTPINFVFTAESDTAGFILSTYKDVTFTPETGTSLPVLNNNSCSDRVADFSLILNPDSLSIVGATIYRTADKGTAVNPAKRSAGTDTAENKVILCPNSHWLLQITNKSTNENDMNVTMQMYA